MKILDAKIKFSDMPANIKQMIRRIKKLNKKINKENE